MAFHYQDLDDFRSSYIDEVVQQAKILHDANDETVRILDLCTGKGFVAVKILERLIENKIPAEATFMDISYDLLKDSWAQAQKAGVSDSIKYAIRDITKPNDPAAAANLSAQGSLDLINLYHEAILPAHTPKHTFSEGSFDIITGTLPFNSLLKQNFREAVESTAPLLSADGSIVIITGYSNSKYPDTLVGNIRKTIAHWKCRRNEKAYDEGVNHQELDKYFAHVGFQRIGKLHTSTVEFGPFNFNERITYQRTT